MESPSAISTAQTVVELCASRLPTAYKWDPLSDIQVITPSKKGEAGTQNLNRLLQEALNPPDGEKNQVSVAGRIFRVGDKVMKIKNNYNIEWVSEEEKGTGIFNGDIGTVTTIDHSEENLTVVFDGREARYDFAQLNELEPAYAMTVHKSQGSEYRAVVLCAWNGSPYLLSRSVLYTAVTRAKELLVIVGREEVIAAMTENTKGNRRYTGLKLRLQQ